MIWSHESSDCKRRGIWAAVGLCCALGYERNRDSQSDSGHDFSLWRPAASVAGLLVTGGPYLLAALLTHGKTLAIGGGDIKLMGACGFVLGVWPGLLHSILSLILAVLTGVMLFGVRRQDFSSIRLPLAPFFCIGGVTAYWLAAAAAVI